MSWLDKILPPKIKKKNTNVSSIPEGLWLKCPSCTATLYSTDLIKNLEVCPKCGYHNYVSARERIRIFLDENSFEETEVQLKPVDFLKFRDTAKYTERLHSARKNIQEEDALVTGIGTLQGMRVVVAVFEFRFIGGSMGSVVGEKFVRAVKTAAEKNIPFISFAASGGARMQEGLASLMQMAKTSASLHGLSDRHIPFISILTNPTMGGVSASFAFLGDIVIAEPGALIGFAGPRVIQQTVRETLPEGFQRAEFLLKAGALDQIVDRRAMRITVFNLLTFLLNKPSEGREEKTKNKNSQPKQLSKR